MARELIMHQNEDNKNRKSFTKRRKSITRIKSSHRILQYRKIKKFDNKQQRIQE